MTTHRDEKNPRDPGHHDLGAGASLGVEAISGTEGERLFREGHELDLPDGSRVQVAFARSAYPELSSRSSLVEASLPVGVSLEPAPENTGFVARLVVVSAVDGIDRRDITAALNELRLILHESSDSEQLAERIGDGGFEAELIPVDLIWETNAPLSKILSPVSMQIDHFGGVAITSGFSESIRDIFMREFEDRIGERLGDDPGVEEDLLVRLEHQILLECDLHLPEGRDTVLSPPNDPSYQVHASDLPRLLVRSVIQDFGGKRILD